jgi:hypothetical protein
MIASTSSKRIIGQIRHVASDNNINLSRQGESLGKIRPIKDGGLAADVTFQNNLSFNCAHIIVPVINRTTAE